MKIWIKTQIRKFLGIDKDKAFILEYGDAISRRVDTLDDRG